MNYDLEKSNKGTGHRQKGIRRKRGAALRGETSKGKGGLLQKTMILLYTKVPCSK